MKLKLYRVRSNHWNYFVKSFKDGNAIFAIFDREMNYRRPSDGIEWDRAYKEWTTHHDVIEVDEDPFLKTEERMGIVYVFKNGIIRSWFAREQRNDESGFCYHQINFEKTVFPIVNQEQHRSWHIGAAKNIQQALTDGLTESEKLKNENYHLAEIAVTNFGCVIYKRYLYNIMHEEKSVEYPDEKLSGKKPFCIFQLT